MKSLWLFFTFWFSFVLVARASVTFTTINEGYTTTSLLGVFHSTDSTGSGGFPYTQQAYSGVTVAPGASYSSTFDDSAYGDYSYQEAVEYYTAPPSGVTGFSPPEPYTYHAGGTVTFYVFPNGTNTIYTNVTLCVQNSYTVNATADWYWNGTLVQQATLAPGQQDCWTSPLVEVSPAAQAFAAQTTCTPQVINIDYNTNGTPSFGGSGTSSGDSVSGTGASSTSTPSGGGSASSSGATNYVTSGTNNAVSPVTNAVIWQAPTGAASESTLEAVGSLLHSDVRDVVAGEAVLNSTLLNGFMTVTNSLGQVVLYENSSSNLLSQADGIWKAIATNIAMMATNSQQITFNLTNGASLSLSNYATETTQQGISNLLSGFLSTNFDQSNTGLLSTAFSGLDYTNGLGAPGSAVAWISNTTVYYAFPTNSTQADSFTANTTQIIEGEITDWIASWSDPSSGMSDYYPAVPMVVGTGTFYPSSPAMDLDPLHNVGIANLFAMARQFFTWVIAFAFLEKIGKDAVQVVMILANAHGVNTRSIQATIKSLDS